mmetsp:Transcript_56645/g.124212  ORF Transcript_56645/g.124212 Transcript_56645/m.124212 type:complete len:228 (+) Transcript_56645:56-739(+)
MTGPQKLKTAEDALRALKNIDSTVEEQYLGKKWTCAYIMKDGRTWQKLGIEGPLLVVKKSKGSRYQLCVTSVEGHGEDEKGLLRKDIENTWELERQKQFVFFRAVDAVYGLWFQKEVEADAVHETLVAVVKRTKDGVITPRNAQPASTTGSAAPAAPEQNGPDPKEAVKAWLNEDEDDEVPNAAVPDQSRAPQGGGVSREAVKAALLAAIESGELVDVVHKHLSRQP